jgi:hypothetical protein
MLRDPSEATIVAYWREAGVDPGAIQRTLPKLRQAIEWARRNPRRRGDIVFDMDDQFTFVPPEAPEEPGLGTRIVSAVGRGVADLAGAPVDLVNGTLRTIGLPVSEAPVLGSNWLKENWNVPGSALVNLVGGDIPALSLNDPRLAPQGQIEDFAQRAAQFAGSSILPGAGALAYGGRTINALGLTRATAPTAGGGGAVGQSLTRLSVDAARRPGVYLAGEAGAAIGAPAGGDAMRAAFPNSPTAEMLGNVIGGLGGGGGAGVGTARMRAPLPERPGMPRVLDAQGPVLVLDDAATAARRAMGLGDEPVPARVPMEDIAATGRRLMGLGDDAPVRVDAPPLPPGARLVEPEAAPRDPGTALESPLGTPRPPAPRPSPEEMADTVSSIRPEDVLPRPANRVQSLDEHIEANSGRFRDVEAPNEVAELSMRTVPNYRGEAVRFRGPLDLESFIRSRGGLRDDAGELTRMGITNNRARAEASGEGRLGPIVDPRGMSLDEATEALWEAGYFPNHASRPAIDDVLEALDASRRHGHRTFLPDDMDEVTRFYDAQAQRYAVEAADQSGARLSEDPTTPATRDDLDALDPPATAYEDLPSVTGKVGNINLNAINSAEDIGRLLQNVETSLGGFNAARRGKISFEEMQSLADELGMTADHLLQRRQGQALNAEQALAARTILAKSSDEVIELARRAEQGTQADQAAFSQALLRHAAIHEQVSGAISEAGRTLSSLRATANSASLAGRIHEMSVGTMGGEQRLADVARRILDLQTRGAGPGEVTRFALDAIKPRFSDKLVELWYNSLLSGPQTHVVNMTSNVMTSMFQLPEQAIASAIGQARRGLRAAMGKGDDFDRVLSTELGARAFGMLQGAREGFRAFGRTFRTGEVVDQVTKVEARVQEAIGGRTGTVIRTPTRLLASEDEFFKAVARRMELAALATRQARQEGLRGEARKARIAELVANPPDEMLDRALRYARYLTFQRPLEGLPSDLSRWTQRNPAAKLILPFIRTPTNLFRHAIERSPMAPILREVRRDVRAGGERAAIAMARMSMGTGIGYTVFTLAQEGLITGGGPADAGARDLLLADGWQPYSFKIGDTYYSYRRLDPLATTLGVAADLIDYQSHMTKSQQEMSTALLLTSIMRNVGDKTWLSGLTDAVNALSDPQRYGQAFVSNLVGSLAVPTVVAQVARTNDPIIREARDPIERIQSRLPGLSDNLQPRRDIFGRAIGNEGGAGPDFVSPFQVRERRNDPVIAELLSNGINISRPDRKLRGVELTDEEYSRYYEISGGYIYDDLKETIGGRDWGDADLVERQKIIKGIIRDARADARADLGLDGSSEPPPALPPGAVPAQ